MTKNTTTLYPLLFLLTWLAGCQTDMKDLENYVKKIKAKENPHVEAIPEFRHVPSYFYEVQHMRDPFLPFQENQQNLNQNFSLLTTKSNNDEENKCPPTPEPYRIRAGLELIPLDALEMKGTLEVNGTLWALISLRSDGTIAYKVKSGDKIGNNYGRVINITQTEVEVLEQLPDEEGCWNQVVNKIPLVEG
jgi:type IV pilus assembly protein PilP